DVKFAPPALGTGIGRILHDAAEIAFRAALRSLSARRVDALTLRPGVCGKLRVRAPVLRPASPPGGALELTGDASVEAVCTALVTVYTAIFLRAHDEPRAQKIADGLFDRLVAAAEDACPGS